MNCRLAALSLPAVLAASTSAQLVPDRLYYGLEQRITVRVDAPEGFAGELMVRLHDPATGESVAEAAAAAGRADLAGLLPVLWEERPLRVLLAQLYADGKSLGAPLVLQPLVTPNAAVLVDPVTMQPSMDRRAEPKFEDERLPVLRQRGLAESGEREVTFSGFRVYEDREVVVETSQGAMVFRLRPDMAPNTAFNFLHLVDGGFYTDVMVHRVVAALPNGAPFVIQFGDLSGTGSGDPGYSIDLERSALPHDFGVLSMARATDPNTNGSQVFVCLSREGTSFLDGKYTSFAEAVDGADVIRTIARVAVGEQDRPVEPPVIIRATSRSGPGLDQRPPALSKALSEQPADGGADPGR